MREVVALALAKYRGLALTTDVARGILDSLSGDYSIDPDRFSVQFCEGRSLQCERLRSALPELKAQRMAYLAERYPGRAHDVNWSRLLEMSEQGSQLIFTARDEGGAMVGGMWLHLGVSVNTGVMRLTDDLFYIDPAHRSGMLAARLWRYSEEAAFALGVREATIHMRSVNGAERIAMFAGYEQDAIRFTKRHDGNNFADAPTRHKERVK